MNYGQPMSPEEVFSKERIITGIPQEVFAVFNELLIAGARGGAHSIQITQEEVMRPLLIRLAPITRQEIFERKWLDVEGAFERYGWKVTFEKPGFNESGVSVFTFTPS